MKLAFMDNDRILRKIHLFKCKFKFDYICIEVVSRKSLFNLERFKLSYIYFFSLFDYLRGLQVR